MAITPSGDIAFFAKNRESFDAINNSESSTYVDRGGIVRLTWRGMELKNETMLAGFTTQFNSALATWGRSTLGDWKVGVVVNARNQVVLYSGNYYQWSGALPHTISQASPYSGWLSLGKMQDALLMQNNLSDLQDKAKAQTNLEVFPNKGLLGTTTDLNTLSRAVNVGIYAQVNNTNATLDRNYPVPLAGTLFVTVSAFDGQQMYITYTGRFFFRGQTSFNVWGNWQELANLSVANVFNGRQTIQNSESDPRSLQFHSDIGSYIRSRQKNSDTTNWMIGHASGGENPILVLKNCNSKGTLTNSITMYSDTGAVGIKNEVTGKFLSVSGDGRLTYVGNEVLTTGNAGTVNGIGSDFIKQLTTKATAGSTVTGSTVGTGLSGTWRVLSSEPFVFGSETKYTTLYRRIA